MLCKQASLLWCAHHLEDPVDLPDPKEELFCGLTEMPEFTRRELSSWAGVFSSFTTGGGWLAAHEAEKEKRL